MVNYDLLKLGNVKGATYLMLVLMAKFGPKKIDANVWLELANLELKATPDLELMVDSQTPSLITVVTPTSGSLQGVITANKTKIRVAYAGRDGTLIEVQASPMHSSWTELMANPLNPYICIKHS